MKIIDLEKLWNFIVNFVIWVHIVMQNYVWILEI